MESQIVIKDIDKLLRHEYIDKSIKIIAYETKKLTEPGENYGSLMIAINVNVEVANRIETLTLVAKLPPSNEWVMQMFNSPSTFKKEIGFYRSIVPTLQAFQKMNGMSDEIMEFFPTFYGARMNLMDESDRFDKNAIILLDNVKLSGYDIADRFVGFDLDAAKLILNDLAVFHAVPIALKLRQPDVFAERIMPYLEKIKLFALEERIQRGILNQLIEVVQNNSELKQYVPRVQAVLSKNENGMNEPLYKSEPFATMCHCDYWVNNTMLKNDENGKAIKNKMVDFQILEYASPGHDIVFFLHTSVQQKVLDQFYEELLHCYYAKFVDTLKKLNCDTTPFTYEKLMDELKSSANQMQFYHILLMYKPIFLKKNGVSEEVTPDTMLSMDNLAEEYYTKFYATIKHFVNKNWI